MLKSARLRMMADFSISSKNPYLCASNHEIMKKTVLFLLLAACTQVVSAQSYTLKDIVGGKFSAYGAPSMESAADGLHYYQMNREKNAVVKFSYVTGNAVDTLFSTRKARECTFDTFEGFSVSPDENRVLVYRDREQIYRHSFKATYYYHDVRRNLVRKLTENTCKQMIPTFSPDGKMLAYVCDNNIWLAKFDFDTESQITKDGAFNKIINGSTDWVYEEEFATTRLMQFSLDNKLLAFVRSDESQVPLYRFQTFEEQLYPGFYEYKYPKPGQKNSSVECRVFDIDAKTTRTMAVPMDKDGYIPRITFTNNPDELAVMTLNRDQNRFDMYFVNPRTTVAKLILRDENKYYVDSEFLKTIHFLNGRFTYISEKDGYSHIYIYGNTGTLQKQLTQGSYDVTDLLAVNPETGTVFYAAADESPLQRNIYKVNIDKPKAVKISTKAGFNSAGFSENGKYFVNRWSDAATPGTAVLYDENGKEIRVLQDNTDVAQRVKDAGLPQKEYITVPAADGTTKLNAWVLKPKNFDPNKKYPMVMIQYSGPNSQQVMNRYGIDWEYALLNEGYLVGCVDGRGTGARGEEFRKCTYMKLGILESDDQAAAAHYFGTLPYVDGSRIGIWGWSYGGYNVLMSMSRGNGVFKAGVAIAAVSDWRFYDSIYTERFMRTPQQNASGYDNGSALKLADKLQGNLLLIHGTADDNVHLQNAMEYTRALTKADKQFEMFIFPDKNHSIYGGNTRLYLYQKVIDFYKKNL